MISHGVRDVGPAFPVLHVAGHDMVGRGGRCCQQWECGG